MLQALITGLLLLFLSFPAVAKLDVFACEPEWASLVQELGRDKVKVFSATTAKQDPHRIQARPSLIAKMRRADMVVCTGAELETGWLPILLRRATNPKVQPGQPGYFEAAQHVALLDKPARIDRAEGDIHAAGDPHIHLNPHNISRVAKALTSTLKIVDPNNAVHYQQNSDDFLSRWQQAITRWELQAQSLRNLRVVTVHKSWAYLLDWLGMQEVARLEPKPGIQPSSAYLGKVLESLKHQSAHAILVANYQGPKPAKWLQQRTGTPVVTLPYTIGGTDKVGDLFQLFDVTLEQLLTGTTL
jgi:zinc/manganese transport system substrate-binding protein